MAGRQESQPLIEVRALTQLSELSEAVRLQKIIWGFDDIEIIPLRLFVTASKVGGQVFGAFDADRLIGFCLAIPGIKSGGKIYLHSHMLAVLPDYRNAGVGRVLKLAQRTDALRRGINLIEWTFDPLEIKNAYFNIERLGAIVRRYVLNQYGRTSSTLHAGLPTDRCVPEWWLASPRVERIQAGQEKEHVPEAARISVPTDIEKIKHSDPSRAREIQQRISDQFLEHFSNGLAVTGFERGPEFASYLFTADDKPWDFK
ncbi:MAG: GNAT family N-acetyltransferase [Bryobacteraceae bacterium]|jgi:predicted GNAT superfamily acetyltransferase